MIGMGDEETSLTVDGGMTERLGEVVAQHGTLRLDRLEIETAKGWVVVESVDDVLTVSMRESD